MNTLNIIIATLLVYWTIATIVVILTDENEEVMCAFAIGVVGLLLILIMSIVRKLIFYFKYRYNKRSIFEEESTGVQYKCELKDTDNIFYWSQGYKLVKRYASRAEWKNLPDLDKEFIFISRRNCSNCKYDEECYDHPKCKHDKYE